MIVSDFEFDFEYVIVNVNVFDFDFDFVNEILMNYHDDDDDDDVDDVLVMEIDDDYDHWNDGKMMLFEHPCRLLELEESQSDSSDRSKCFTWCVSTFRHRIINT